MLLTLKRPHIQLDTLKLKEISPILFPHRDIWAPGGSSSSFRGPNMTGTTVEYVFTCYKVQLDTTFIVRAVEPTEIAKWLLSWMPAKKLNLRSSNRLSREIRYYHNTPGKLGIRISRVRSVI